MKLANTFLLLPLGEETHPTQRKQQCHSLVLLLMLGMVAELKDVLGVESRLKEKPASSSSSAFPEYTVRCRNNTTTQRDNPS